MIKDQTFNKFGIWGKFMDHVHDFDHVQIDGFVWDFDDIDSINDDVNKLVGEVWMKFTAEWGSGNTYEKWFLYGLFLDFELFQKLEWFFSGEFVALSDDSGVDLLNDKIMNLLIGWVFELVS